MRKIPVAHRIRPEIKTSVKRFVPGPVLSRVRPNAIRTLRGAEQPPAVSAEVPLWAMLCTWMEEDIVFASVRNAFDNGVDRVFLLDNGSTDNTVREATEAGAEHIMSFSTESFDELFKYELINAQVERLSRQSGFSELWWLMMDADEFLSAPESTSVKQFISTVDKRCRVVGARVLDHYPQSGSTYFPRSSPRSFHTLCREKRDHRCELGHHKHPLFRWRGDRRPIVVEPGFHQLRCYGEPLFEPPRSLVLDHYPFRNEEAMRARLDLLEKRGSTRQSTAAGADAHMRARQRSLDYVYSQQYDKVIDHRTGRAGIHVDARERVLGIENSSLDA